MEGNERAVSIIKQESRKEREALRKFDYLVGSPVELTIIRNAISVLIDAGYEPDPGTVAWFIANDSVRNEIIKSLKEKTPKLWSNAWERAWVKEREPLWSSEHQRIMRITSAINFFENEFSTISHDIVKNLAKKLGEHA